MNKRKFSKLLTTVGGFLFGFSLYTLMIKPSWYPTMTYIVNVGWIAVDTPFTWILFNGLGVLFVILGRILSQLALEDSKKSKSKRKREEKLKNEQIVDHEGELVLPPEYLDPDLVTLEELIS